MKILHSIHPDDFRSYPTNRVRENFLIGDIVQNDQINFAYTHYDRMMIGAACPVHNRLALENYECLKARYFLERREIGVINVAGPGQVDADGQVFELKKLDCLYIGKGIKDITFSSNDPSQPAVFYLLSATAHVNYPTVLMTHTEAHKVHAGDLASANRRTINKYIHLNGIRSCQLVMGLTTLEPGCVWNTMPPHTHDRRTEVYFYFDLPAGQRVFHLMGEGNETRHIVVNNYEAVVSPPWSIHSGGGTSSYNFIWGMAGENLDYTDMDLIAIPDIK